MRQLAFVILCSALFMYSCEFTHDQRFNPSALTVSSVSLRNNNNQSISHNIRDLWVFIDDQFYGSFSVPFSIPILESGEKRIQFYPGIRFYGILSKPEIYTLIEPVELKSKLVPNDTLELDVIYYYKKNISITIEESFETGSIFINDLDSLPNSNFLRKSFLSPNGNYAGLGSLDLLNPTIETASTFFTIPSKKTVFLEFDFKADIDFNAGILSFPSKTKNYYLTLRSASDWKKIYIPLNEVLSENPDQRFQLAFRGSLTNNQPLGFFAIDNIRVLSFQ